MSHAFEFAVDEDWICPFCGEEDLDIVSDNGSDAEGYHDCHMKCRSCGERFGAYVQYEEPKEAT